METLMFFVRFLQILILWWILSLLFRWWRQLTAPGSRSAKSEPHRKPAESDVIHSGEIDDADFEEIE